MRVPRLSSHSNFSRKALRPFDLSSPKFVSTSSWTTSRNVPIPQKNSSTRRFLHKSSYSPLDQPYAFASSSSLNTTSETPDKKPPSKWQGIPNGKLADKKVVITGASRGIGAEIARKFAAEGATCVMVGRNESLLKGVMSELRGAEHKVVVGDVGTVEFWSGMKKEKDIDVLVNAAGVTHFSPLVVTTPELLEEVLRTNLMGTMLGCRAVGKVMMGNPTGGCIVNVASLLGMKGGKGSAAYAASKAGVIGLTRALAAELGPRNVRVNVIAPGYIETDMTEAMMPEARSQALDAIPLKRFGYASDIADAAVFLVANKYANNCVLNLDGGLSAV